MIYFISDIHEDINFNGLQEYLKIATNNDLLIILGDIGLNFRNTEENKQFTKQFLGIDKKIAFVEGNHENFDYYNSFPIIDWCGGKAHKLTENIVHLMRGNVYDIEGIKAFAFGGCKSSAKWIEEGPWFFGEEATEQECIFAKANLKKHGNKVDLILTHKYEILGMGNVFTELFLELCSYIDKMVDFKMWLTGHWHREGEYDAKHKYIYNNLVPITKI